MTIVFSSIKYQYRNHSLSPPTQVMTYDNAGNAYYGPIANVSADGTTLGIARGFKPNTPSYTNRVQGGAMVAIRGAGAGQYRRVVRWPGTIGANGGTFDIDSPLTAPLDSTSIVEVMPMR